MERIRTQHAAWLCPGKELLYFCLEVVRQSPSHFLTFCLVSELLFPAARAPVVSCLALELVPTIPANVRDHLFHASEFLIGLEMERNLLIVIEFYNYLNVILC